jgi:hypothetical protein
MSYQPYGRMAPPPPPPGGRNPFKAFGITYMAVRGPVVLFILFAGIVLSAIAADSSGRGAAMAAELEGILALIVIIGIAWLAYVIAAGVIALKRMVASVYMGFADAALTTIFAFWTVSQGEVGPFFCWMIPNGAIITLGILALKNRNAPVPFAAPYPAQYGAPAPYPPLQYGAPAPYPPPQYGAPAPYPPPQHGAPAPHPAYQQPAPQPAPQGVTSAVVPSPKVAALAILALAASVDPDISNEALGRARVVAAKLLGPAAAPRIQRQLAAPVAVMDVDADLMQHTMLLNQQANPAMKANVVKAVEYVLAGPNGIEGLGEQFIGTLKAQLGV